MFGTSTPSTNNPEPMPVPNVSTSTTPSRPRPAPYRISASPAASASLTTWTSTSYPTAFVNRASASVPIHDLSTLAALSVTPRRTTAGNVTPTGPDHSKWATSCATTSAIAAGVAGCGVWILYRSAVRVPSARSTGAAFIPEPPMSMPNESCARTRATPSSP